MTSGRDAIPRRASWPLRGTHLPIDMLRAVRVAKCGGHGVQDDGSHTRIDWCRRVVIQIDGGYVGQLHVQAFPGAPRECSPAERDTLHALGHPHREEQVVTWRSS